MLEYNGRGGALLLNEKKKTKHEKKELVLESSLQWYFFDKLQVVNEKSSNPLPGELLFYSSLVLDKMGGINNYFEVNEGKIKDKVLGVKLLQSSKLSKQEQKRALQDVGESALMICGYFSDSLNRKIVDTDYYRDLGITAYRKLDNIVPQAYQVSSFFKIFSETFHSITTMIGLIAEENHQNGKHNSEVSFLILDKKIS